LCIRAHGLPFSFSSSFLFLLPMDGRQRTKPTRFRCVNTVPPPREVGNGEKKNQKEDCETKTFGTPLSFFSLSSISFIANAGAGKDCRGNFTYPPPLSFFPPRKLKMPTTWTISRPALITREPHLLLFFFWKPKSDKVPRSE